MAHHNDAAIRRAADRETLIVAHPEQNIAAYEITQAADRAHSTAMYASDALWALIGTFVVSFLLLPTWGEPSDPNTPTSGQFWTWCALVGAVMALFFVVIPLLRRVSARDLLGRLDLDNALEVDLPNNEVTDVAWRFNRQWGRESRARAEHLKAAWSLASSGWLHESSGRQMRHRNGPCPGCKAGDKQWCADDCALLDPADYR